MPLYEYKCTSCGAVFEVIQRFSDDPLTVHENCGGAVERLISAPAFQFKGTGWYITDYARGKNGGSAPAKETKSDTSKSDTSKSESKPAAASKPETTTKSTAPATK